MSVLNLKDFLKDNFDFRLDAEYFLKSNLKQLEALTKVGYKKVADFGYVTDGIHTSIDYSEDSKINLFSATTPRENYFDLSRQAFISKVAHEQNPRTALKENDIIISTVGTIGNCAVVNKTVLPANSDRHVGIIRLKNDKFLPRYVSTFLLTKFGRFQTWRESTGNVQLNLFLYRIRTLKIANLSNQFQSSIEQLILLNDKKREQSQSLYTQAENLLLHEIGLQDFAPSQEAVNIKSFKESFGVSGRLDAEYYQVKYDDYLALIKSYSNGFEKLETACNLKDNNYNPNENSVYKYIELSNIGKAGDITDCTEEIGKELPSRARRKVNTNDVIISSIEGSLQSCAVVSEQYNNSLCSTGFYVINSEKLNCETLLVLFKSEPVQNILKQNCSGTILTAINKTEFQNILIPLIEKSVQQQIANLVSESFRLKAISEQLLETAKRAVEIAIEQDEEVAMEYLNAKKYE